MREIRRYFQIMRRGSDFYPEVLDYGKNNYNAYNVGDELGSGHVVSKEEVGLVGPFFKKKRLWVCRSRDVKNCTKCVLLNKCEFPAKGA